MPLPDGARGGCATIYSGVATNVFDSDGDDCIISVAINSSRWAGFHRLCGRVLGILGPIRNVKEDTSNKDDVKLSNALITFDRRGWNGRWYHLDI